MIKKALTVILLLNCSPVFAAPAWYLGTINRFWPNDPNGGFIITFTAPSSLDDCKYSYAYFRTTDIQPDLLKNAFSVALSAFHAGSKVGVVIDKGPAGEYCNATSIDLRK